MDQRDRIGPLAAFHHCHAAAMVTAFPGRVLAAASPLLACLNQFGVIHSLGASTEMCGGGWGEFSTGV